MRTVNTESNTDMDIDDITENPKETIQNNNNKK